MVSLLKQKSKIGIVQKERKKYGLADVFKRRRTEDGNTEHKDEPKPGPIIIDKFGHK